MKAKQVVEAIEEIQRLLDENHDEKVSFEIKSQTGITIVAGDGSFLLLEGTPEEAVKILST